MSGKGPRLRIAAWTGVLALAYAALPVGALAGGAGAAVTVQRVRIVEEAGAIEVGIEATGPVQYRTMVLSDPLRYVIDLPGTLNGVGWSLHRVGIGPMRAVRVGQATDAPPVTRVVLDLARPIRWSLRHASAAVVVAKLEVAAAHGPAGGPWDLGAAGTAGAPSGPETAAATSATGPERPAGAGVEAGPPAAPSAASATGVAVGSVRAGPPSDVPGVIVAQQPGGGRLLTLDLRDVKLGDVLDALARLCGLNIVTSSSVSGATVTLHLVGVTCQEALRYLLDANGLGFRRVGETLIVEPIAQLTPPPPGPVLRVYRLQYLQPPLVPEAITGGGSGGQLSGAAGTAGKDAGALLALFAGTGAKIVYDDRTNSLIATGTPAQHAALVALLRQLDVPVPEVAVQAIVVDITASSLRNLGIQWSIANGVQFTETTPGGTGTTTPPGQLGIGPITRDLLFAKIQALVTQNTAKILSDPRITTYDGQEALIFAGDQVPIVNTTTSGNPPVTTQTVTFQPIGVTLKIVPRINADRTINVLVHPVVTTASSFTAGTPNNPSGLPIIAIREAVTSLRVGDGDSVILGGLMRYSDVKNLQKIPFLGDLPLIGSLFRLTSVNHSESEVVIVITPRIVATGQPVQQ